MAPNLQEQMLLQGQVDISAVFTATSYMNLVAQKLDPDKDFRWIYFADSGLDLYSNGIMVSAKLAKEKPDAVKGLVRAIARAMREVVADPAAAIELLAAKEPLINKDIEKRRLIYVVKTLIATPEAAELGVGDIKDARMSEAIATIVAAYELPKSPAVGDVFNRSFLPPKGERVLPAAGQLKHAGRQGPSHFRAAPDDVSGIEAAIAAGRIDPAGIRAIFGKTEGNGCVNDFSRGFAVQSLQLMLQRHGGAGAGACLVMSGGTEGGMAPHWLVLERGRGRRCAQPDPRWPSGRRIRPTSRPSRSAARRRSTWWPRACAARCATRRSRARPMSISCR